MVKGGVKEGLDVDLTLIAIGVLLGVQEASDYCIVHFELGHWTSLIVRNEENKVYLVDSLLGKNDMTLFFLRWVV